MTLLGTEIWVAEFANASAENAIVIDGSAASTNFFISVSASAEYTVRTIIFELQDTKSFEPNEFADTGGSLSAGISIKILSSDLTEIADITGGDPIKDNSHLVRFFDDVGVEGLTNTTNAVLSGVYDFVKHHGEPLTLKTGQRLNVAINDDLTGLVDFRLVAKGTRRTF